MHLSILFSALLILSYSLAALGERRCAFSTFINTENQNEVYSAVSLGRSLLNTDTHGDRIIVIYGPYNAFTNRILELAGWTIVDATTHYVIEREIDDPGITSILAGNQGKEALMAKFFVFTLTDYDTVVYLDNNVIVAANINELCLCTSDLGSVSQSRKHNIGVMTLTPSKEMFGSIATAIHEGIINEPYDIFAYFYRNNECPYFDPLLETSDNIPSVECVRLPGRYNGDVAYHLFDGFIDSQLEIDKPKVLYYSLTGIEPWCWWNSILLPQYWIWSSSYMKAIDDARTSFNFTTVDWACRFGFSILLFYLMPLTSLTNLARLFSNFYVNERHATVPFSKLILFQFFNLLIICFGYAWSNVYVSHPVMNIILYVFTMEGACNMLLFSHLNNAGTRIKVRAVYIVGSYIFLVSFLNTAMLPPDFLFRLLLLVVYFTFVHAIAFSYLFITSSHSLYVKLPTQSRSSSSKEPTNPIIDAFYDLFPNKISARPPNVGI